jgi:hypothetical protein
MARDYSTAVSGAVSSILNGFAREIIGDEKTGTCQRIKSESRYAFAEK